MDKEKGELRDAGKLLWEEIPGDRITAPLSAAGPYVISHRWNIVPTRDDETRKVWYFPLSYRPPNEHHHVGNFDTLEAAKAAAQLHADACKTERGVFVGMLDELIEPETGEDPYASVAASDLVALRDRIKRR